MIRTTGQLLALATIACAVTPVCHAGEADPGKVVDEKIVLTAGPSDQPGDIVKCLAFSPDGRELVSGNGRHQRDGGVRGEIKVWDLGARSVRATLQAGTNWPINSVAMSPDGKTLVSGSLEQPPRAMAGVIQVWDMASSRELKRIELRGQPISHVAISPDGRWLAAGTLNEGKANLRVWEFPKIQERASVDAHRSAVTSLAFTADSRFLVSAGHDERFRIWSVSKWSQTAVRNTDAEQCIIRLPPVRSPLLAATSGKRSNEIVLWDYAKAQPIRKLAGHKRIVSSMSFSADGQILASGAQTIPSAHESEMLSLTRAGAEFKIWDVQRGAELASIPVDVSGVTDLVFSPSGRLLACAEGNNAITLWKIASTAAN